MTIDELFDKATDEDLGFHLPTDSVYQNLSDEDGNLFSIIFVQTATPLFYILDPRVTELSLEERISAFYLSTGFSRGFTMDMLSKIPDPDKRKSMSMSWALCYMNNVNDFIVGIEEGSFTHLHVLNRLRIMNEQLRRQEALKKGEDYKEEDTSDRGRALNKILDSLFPF